MPLHIEYSSDVRVLIPLKERKLLDEVYSKAIILEASFVADVSVLSLEEMRSLNQETRNVNKPTDVLSYPIFSSIESIPLQHIPEVMLGSIVICPEYANEQGTPLVELVHHGIMHLFGYDHETDQAAWDANERGILEEAKNIGLPLVGLSNIARP